MFTITTNSSESTQKLGEELAQNPLCPKTIALFGDLGSGKTTFIQGFAQGLGIQKKIISPTFIIMRSYSLFKPKSTQHSPRATRTFYHVDLYRINNENEMNELGIFNLLNDENSVFAFEWPEKIEKYLPRDKVSLYFKYLDGNYRQIASPDYDFHK